MIHLDTSVLIDSFTGAGHSWPAMRRWIAAGEILTLSTLVIYEWRRGPRQPEELAVQREYFPDARAVPFGAAAASLGAELYRTLPRARARQMDIAIAACAILEGAHLWTLNRGDFADIPGLKLVTPDVA